MAALSLPIRAHVRWKTEVTVLSNFEDPSHPFRSSRLAMPGHGFTHCDGFSHFIPGGTTVDRMPLVEIIKGVRTSSETVERCEYYVRQIGKTAIVVNDSRGFYTSRVFGTYTMEGAALLLEGQDPGVIEAVGVEAGMPVGPLAILDEISLTLCVQLIEQTRRGLAAEGKPAPATPGIVVIERMVRELSV